VRREPEDSGIKVVGLFAGIGGIELGLARSGHETILLCENDPAASAVLEARFPDIENVGDIRDIDELPANTDMLAAGFPCQDLSPVGRTSGLDGNQSSLVDHVFRLLEDRAVEWVLLENVSFMLQLGRGKAIRYIADRFERLGYRWAYRVIDTRAFGIPQRRRRVFFLASQTYEPEEVLFADDAGEPWDESYAGQACGFYWTEGNRGLGWAVDSVPTLKGGSTLGIPSPPAIWFPDGRIVTPALEDAERLQGFRAGWTEPAERVSRKSVRWRLVGNAVTVDCAAWVGDNLDGLGASIPDETGYLSEKNSWPSAGFGDGRRRYSVSVSEWPTLNSRQSLAEFLKYKPKPLSERATAGFVSRLEKSGLNSLDEFREALHEHLQKSSNGQESISV